MRELSYSTYQNRYPGSVASHSFIRVPGCSQVAGIIDMLQKKSYSMNLERNTNMLAQNYLPF